MIRFSVIIPTLYSSTIGDTLAALRHQTFNRSQFEVIVVGKDKELASGEWGYFYPTEEVLFPGAARNLGATKSQGEILVFTDSDCIPEPHWLEVLAEKFANPKVHVVGGGVKFTHNNYWTTVDNISMFYEYLASNVSGFRKQLPSLNLAVRRQQFLDLGGFDPKRRTSEDSELTSRLRLSGYTLYFEPQAAVAHAPSRYTPKDLFQHHFLHGKHSLKFDPKYNHNTRATRFLGTRWGVLMASPFLAAGVTTRIFLTNRELWRFWYTAPAIFLGKMIWCVGAASRPQKSRNIKK